ncbi:hypothetical protein MMC27_004558 [Xylographa pallens]|nr:hypothetical protein [Xylographa pallens]
MKAKRAHLHPGIRMLNQRFLLPVWITGGKDAVHATRTARLGSRRHADTPVVVGGAAEATVELPAAAVETVETAETVEAVELVEMAGLDELDGTEVGGFVLATIVAALGALLESTCPLPATLFGLLKYTLSRLGAPQNSFLFPLAADKARGVVSLAQPRYTHAPSTTCPGVGVNVAAEDVVVVLEVVVVVLVRLVVDMIGEVDVDVDERIDVDEMTGVVEVEGSIDVVEKIEVDEGMDVDREVEVDSGVESTDDVDVIEDTELETEEVDVAEVEAAEVEAPKVAAAEVIVLEVSVTLDVTLLIVEAEAVVDVIEEIKLVVDADDVAVAAVPLPVEMGPVVESPVVVGDVILAVVVFATRLEVPLPVTIVAFAELPVVSAECVVVVEETVVVAAVSDKDAVIDPIAKPEVIVPAELE